MDSLRVYEPGFNGLCTKTKIRVEMWVFEGFRARGEVVSMTRCHLTPAMTRMG